MFCENNWKGIYLPGLSMVNKIIIFSYLPGQGFSTCMPLYFAQCGRLNSLFLTNRIIQLYTFHGFILGAVHFFIPPHLDFWIDHIPCFDHWDVARCDMNRYLICASAVGLFFLHKLNMRLWPGLWNMTCRTDLQLIAWSHAQLFRNMSSAECILD